VIYNFPQRGQLSPLTLTWYEGQEPPRPEGLEEGRNLPSEGGVLFKGSKGTIMCGVYGQSPRLIPESAMESLKRPEKTLPRVEGGIGGHEKEWVRACKGGAIPGAHFDYSGPLTELALLGNVAKRFQGNLLKWDGGNMKVTNLKKANAWIQRPYRDGWSL
jgi:hypothetical protein